jgi:intracellular multiplication protein IcmO
MNTELFLPADLMSRHCLGIAATGGGKTNFLNLILKQQMIRGGGVIHIDGKNNKSDIGGFLTLAKQHNRWHDVRIINIDDSTLSNTYNPLLRGDAEEITTRIMLLMPGGGKDTYFRSQASKAVGAVVSLLKEMGLPFSFSDLNAVFSSEGLLRYLLKEGPKETEAYAKFKIFFDQLHEEDRRTGMRVLNTKVFQHTFGDLTGKIAAYDRGEAFKVVNAYNPEVDLLSAMQQNQLIYVALPMLSKAEVATDFAKIFLSDLRTAVGQLQNLPTTQHPNPTFWC